MMAEHIRMTALIFALLGKNACATAAIIVIHTILALIYWRNTKLQVADGYLYIQRGAIIRRQAQIKITDISAVATTRSLIDIIMGSTSVKIFTQAGEVCGKRGVKIFAKSRDELCLFLGFVKGGKKTRSTFFKVLLQALSTTSVLAGIFLIFPLMENNDALFTKNELFIEKIEKLSEKIFGLPPLVNLAITIYLIAIGTSLTFLIVRQIGHTTVSNRETISVTFGLIPKSEYVLRQNAINSIFYEQTPVLSILDKFFLKSDIAGLIYTRKNELYLSLPISQSERSASFLKFHAVTSKKRKVVGKFKRAEQWRYFVIPFCCFSTAVIVLLVVYTISPWLSELIIITATIVLTIFLYQLYLMKYAYLNTKIDLIEGDAHFTRNASIIIAKFLTEKIGQVTLTTFPYDRKSGVCTLKLGLRTEHGTKIKVKFMDHEEIKEQLKILKIY